MAKELTSYERLDRINARFDEVRDQLSKVNEQIDKLATVIVKGFDRIDKTLETKADKSDLQRVYDLLDKTARKLYFASRLSSVRT